MMAREQLDQRAATLLAKLLGMLGSDHDGERASAAAKADALVRKLGLTWRDVVPSSQLEVKHEAEGVPTNPICWRLMRSYCFDRAEHLRPREYDFIVSLGDWRGSLTEKQFAWLRAIYSKLKGTA